VPDGIFPDLNLQFWYIWKGLGMKKIEMLYCMVVVAYFKMQIFQKSNKIMECKINFTYDLATLRQSHRKI
jgi:hypothetical protein